MILSEYLSPMPGNADNWSLVALLMSTRLEAWVLAAGVLAADLDEPLWAMASPANKSKVNIAPRTRVAVVLCFISFFSLILTSFASSTVKPALHLPFYASLFPN